MSRYDNGGSGQERRGWRRARVRLPPRKRRRTEKREKVRGVGIQESVTAIMMLPEYLLAPLLHVDRYGHIRAMVDAVAKGVTAAGGEPVVRMTARQVICPPTAPQGTPAPITNFRPFLFRRNAVDLPSARDAPQGGPREDGRSSQGRERTSLATSASLLRSCAAGCSTPSVIPPFLCS